MINTDVKFIPNTPKINVREAQGKEAFIIFIQGILLNSLKIFCNIGAFLKIQLFWIHGMVVGQLLKPQKI